MKPNTTNFHDIRGIRYHVRTWGNVAHAKLVMLHGWMDVAASFQFVVDALRSDWHVIAPDWRGFGLSSNASESYWFPDYLADLDAIIDVYAPDAPVVLVGHSMGGNVAGLYAGARPHRVSRLVLAEGFGMKATEASHAPKRYARWLDEVKEGASLKPYTSFAEVAQRLMRNNPRLSQEKADFLAPYWARVTTEGRIELAADPRHKWVNPTLYRLDEAIACWRNITAPTLWLWGEDAGWMQEFAKDTTQRWDERRAAFARLTECTIAAAGHMLHHDQPARFAQLVEDFALDRPITHN